MVLTGERRDYIRLELQKGYGCLLIKVGCSATEKWCFYLDKDIQTEM